MSNLYSGGSRANLFARIFGFENIHRATRRKWHGRGAETSIAKANRHTGKPHEHKREIARRLRQAERRAAL